MQVQEIDPRNIERDAAVKAGAFRLIREKGLSNFYRSAIAQYAGVSETSVSNFGRTSLSTTSAPKDGYRERLLRALMADAIEQKDIVMISAGLVDGCLTDEMLTDELRLILGR